MEAWIGNLIAGAGPYMGVMLIMVIVQGLILRLADNRKTRAFGMRLTIIVQTAAALAGLIVHVAQDLGLN